MIPCANHSCSEVPDRLENHQPSDTLGKNSENAEIKVFSDSTKPNQLFLYINRQPIDEWLKEQWNNLRPFKI